MALSTTASEHCGTVLHTEIESEPWETIAVLELCRTANLIQGIDDEHAALGWPPTTVNSKGDEVTHPRVAEVRITGAARTKLLASLRLSNQDDVRPQRRDGARGKCPPRRDLRAMN